jgi:hypothetical protein
VRHLAGPQCRAYRARMPPRAGAASLACVLVVGIVGCGVGAGAGESDVQAAVSSYVRASAAGNGEQACAYYTPALRAEIDRKARENGLKGCTELLGSAVRYRLSQLPGDVQRRVQDAIGDPENVDVDMGDEGDRAGAALELPGDAMTETRVALVKLPEGWRIERLGVKEGG